MSTSEQAPLLIGVDLGGTKIEGVVLDTATGRLRDRRRIPTEAHQGYDHILNQIRALVDSLEGAQGDTPIGIGTPGVLDPLTRGMKNANTTALNGRPLDQDLNRVLGREVRLANDANCLALAETLWGAGAELPAAPAICFGIILGTGVGGGVVINGQVREGAHGIAGEWGHNPLLTTEAEAQPCYCGLAGCVETVISGPALERWYANSDDNGKDTPTGEDRIRLPEIARRARQPNAAREDPRAVATLNRLCQMFARALSPIVNVLDPDVMIIGGGVGQIEALYSEETRALIGHYAFNDRWTAPLLRPLLGDSAGVFGAAALFAPMGLVLDGAALARDKAS